MAIYHRCAIFSAAVLLTVATALADPITGLTYTYDLSQPDPFSGVFTMPHPDEPANDTVDATDPAAVTSKGVLVDMNLGSLEFTNPATGCCLFNNGTYAGFRNDGAGGASQPKIDIDLGGLYMLTSFTLHYLVEDRPSIYAPQPVKDTAGNILYNGLTVSGSTNGEDFTELGFYNDFKPVFGPDGDFGTDAAEVRTATIDLTGTTASHISVDIHTPWSWIFLSEVVIEGASSASPGDFDLDGDVDGADFLAWQQGLGGAYDATHLAGWIANFGAGGASAAAASIPEPAALTLLVVGSLMLAARRRS